MSERGRDGEIRTAPQTAGLRVVTPGWLKERAAQVDALRRSRESSPRADTSLLAIAGQHPLVDGKAPSPEFEERLKAGRERYEKIAERGGKAAFFLSGSRHHDPETGQTDKVAQYDAAGRWLVDHGVPATALHGKDWIDVFRPEGLYHGAAEVGVAAAGFARDPSFRDAEYFCSPGQVSRARTYALAYGVPLTLTVPESLEEGVEQFHDRPLQAFVLKGLANTIDPYGDGVLARLTKSRIPEDGNFDTVPDLLHEYADMPWHGGTAR